MEKTKYYLGIKRYILSRIRSPHDAEDLAQFVFLEFYRIKNREDCLESPESYLFGIARNLIGHYYRQKHKQPGLLQMNSKISDKISYDNYSKDSRAIELTERVENIVSKLPPKAREAVELRLIDNLSYKEAAFKANCTIDIFYNRFYEGLKILKEKIRTQHL